MAYRNRFLLVMVSAACLFMTGCKTEQKKSIPEFKHIIMICPDGFSSDVVRENPGKFPNIEKLIERGSYTFKARSVLPSSSAINWMTLLSGAGSEMHGFTTWGSKTPEVEPAYVNEYGMFPTIFGETRKQMPDAVTGVIYSWDGIGYLFEKEAVDFDLFVETDDGILEQSLKFIEEKKPNLAFIYFSEPDVIGHSKGWSTPEYIDVCVDMDGKVGALVEKIDNALDPETTAIIFTSDHGGIGTGHGGKSIHEMEVPFVMIGKGIPAGEKIERIVMKYDAAPTITDMLGIRAPEQWRGRSLFAE